MKSAFCTLKRCAEYFVVKIEILKLFLLGIAQIGGIHPAQINSDTF